MKLEISPVFRHAGGDVKIYGFELVELWLAGVLMAIMFLLVGRQGNAVAVFVPSLAAAYLLRVVRGGKAPNFLIHCLRWHLSPGVYSPLTTKRKG